MELIIFSNIFGMRIVCKFVFRFPDENKSDK